LCGIVGIHGPLDSQTIQLAIEKMNQSIAHRGPDDEGSWIEDGFGFGVKRLSIIDLMGGHQPQWDEGASTGIVYNGELYNYKAIRNDLEKNGVKFFTSSDTEVILKSLTCQGPATVQSWNGMFAVACWNKRTKKLTLIRDRIGIKPLYYYWDGRIFIFASEIKAILASKLFQPRLNRQAVWDYLTFRYVPSPETMWVNIRKLPPAHILVLSPGEEPRISCYWNNEASSELGPVSFDQKVKEFEEIFLDAVQSRLLAADVPVGVLLSGGLDSSSVTAAAIELGHKHFHTFSVSFEEAEFSELDFARLTARHLDVQHHEVVINKASFLKILPSAVQTMDEPLADLSSIPLFAVSKLARKWVKVVLSGEGGDELFAGYNFDIMFHRWKLIHALQTLPKPLLRIFLWPAYLIPWKYQIYAKHIVDTPLPKWNSVLRVHMTKYWEQEDKIALWPSFIGLNSNRIIDELYLQTQSTIPLEQMLTVYQKSWLVEDLLMKADKITMAASLELRVPFLDHRMVEWANRQVPEIKIRRFRALNYQTKAIIRGFAENRLPKEILKRSKLGFPVPVYSWLKEDEFSKWAYGCVLGKQGYLKNVFSKDIIEKLMALAKQGDMYAAHKIWLLIVLEIWLREYGVNLE